MNQKIRKLYTNNLIERILKAGELGSSEFKMFINEADDKLIYMIKKELNNLIRNKKSSNISCYFLNLKTDLNTKPILTVYYN